MRVSGIDCLEFSMICVYVAFAVIFLTIVFCQYRGRCGGGDSASTTTTDAARSSVNRFKHVRLRSHGDDDDLLRKAGCWNRCVYNVKTVKRGIYCTAYVYKYHMLCTFALMRVHSV